LKVSNNNYDRYDSIVNNTSRAEKPRSISRIKNFLEAFRVDLSQRALYSKEYNDPSINFPTYNEDVLQYSEKLNLIFKP